MAYQAYSTQKVFQDALLNIYCNKIFEGVHTTFPGSEATLVAEGELSEIIQGKATSDLPVISFVTNDEAIYAYLVKNLSTIIAVDTQLSFENRIQLVTEQGNFEFWYDESLAATVNINGLYCRNLGGSYPAPVSPYNIALAEIQIFTESAENELYFKAWKSDVREVKIIYLLSEPDPLTIDINLQIEDVFLTQPAGKYSNFYVAPNALNWSGPTGNTGFMDFAGDMDGQAWPGLELTPLNLQQFFQLTFQNFSLLSPATYSWSLVFLVRGRRTDSGFIDSEITRFEIPCQIEIIENTRILTNVEELHLAHIKNAVPLPAQQFEVVTGVDFNIVLPSYFNLSGGNIVEGIGSLNKKKYLGYGRQTLSISLNETFDAFPADVFSDSILLSVVYRGRLRDTHTVLLSAYMFLERGFIFDPEALSFFVIKGIETPAPQELKVISTEDFTITFPFWLNVNPVAGEKFATLDVLPISANNLVPGEYTGLIKFTSINIAAEVPVMVTVVESIGEAFAPAALNFTDENKEFTHLYSDNALERAAVDMAITVYDSKGFPESSEHAFRISFFNNRAPIHLGEIIARRFKKLASPSAIGYRHYDLEEEYPLFKIYPYARPASVDVSLAIEERTSGEVSESKEFANVLFVKGRKPMPFTNDYGILCYYPVPVRVTSRSQLLFNFVRRFQEHSIKIFRNNILYKTITHSPGNNSLFGLAMIFKDFIPGDVIDIRLAKNEIENHVQQYVMFPLQKHSNHIAFLNEYNVLECFEFTGAFEFSSETKVLASETYKNLVEQIENLETSKEQRLKINTGWILKSNQVIVDAIARSKKVWLLGNGKQIELRPVDMKFNNEDSEQELYAFDLEFLINRENDLEVYTS